ncbi:plasmid replication initiator TrfA [Pseudomonas sp.]|uniref:plasmid replication initiator TrfA n=1 Tax=Pseudomonas sp. TaxID=306 RepID=UPI003C776F2C
MHAVAKLARLIEKAELQSALKQTERSQICLPAHSSSTQMPDWAVDVRGVPNVALRSALFSSSRSGKYLERAEIFAQNPTSVRYTGKRLSQTDHDVWITLLHLSRNDNIDQPLRASAYALLKQQNKTDTGANRATLYKSLDRLKASAVEITDSRYSYTGSLIDSIYKDKSSREIVVSLNSNLIRLFGSGKYTQVDWSIRRSLTNKPLAQWLYGYYSSHAEPIPVSVEILLKMAGSEDSSDSSAENNLRRALNSLKLVLDENSQPFSFQILCGVVHVQKTPTESQRRHLRKKSKARSTRAVPLH